MSESRLSPAETVAGRAYLPRHASQQALCQLEEALGAGETILALGGPEGIGRTSVLQALQRRPSEALRCVYIPYAALPAGEICAWVLGLLETEVQLEQLNRVKLQNSLSEIQQELVTAQGRADQLITELETREEELSSQQEETAARRTHVNELIAELQRLEDELLHAERQIRRKRSHQVEIHQGRWRAPRMAEIERRNPPRGWRRDTPIPTQCQGR